MSDKDGAVIQGISWEILKVTVDYGLSLDEMIAAGKYDWQNNSINTLNFPLSVSRRVNWKVELNAYLVCFNMFVDYDEIPPTLDSYDLKEGDLPILLAIGAEHPKKQIEFPIVQTGNVWPDLQRGGKRGVYLRRGNKERGLAFIWLDHGFPGYYRIIAI